MNLTKLLSSIDEYHLYGKRDTEVKSITDDSRKVNKGDLFVALKGLKIDSHKYIGEAIKKKASVVVGQVEPKKEWLKKATYVKVKDSREVLALLASSWHGSPCKKLTIIGVTGTDGKTTTASLIYSLLEGKGEKVGLISTIGAKISNKIFDTGFHVTNPEPLALHQLLAKMVDSGCKYAILEVTSHGIDQKRIYGIEFDYTVLTNITHEHLDYHKSFKNYQKTKINFLNSGKNVIVNADDPSSRLVKANKVVSYGIKKGDYKAKKIKQTTDGVFFLLNSREGEVSIDLPYFGLFNLHNTLAAIVCVKALNVSNKTIQNTLKRFKLPVGRLQKISNSRNFNVYVDFAHTPNALINALKTLKEIGKGKIICVFGCAGERDKKKREKMGNISAKLANISVFTAEDPRSEDLDKILGKMKNGAKKTGAIEINFGLDSNLKKISSQKRYFALVPQRHEAIAFALNNLAKKGDYVVITGKGHEKSLAYKGFEHPWSDEKVAKNVLGAQDKYGVVVLAAGKGTRMNSHTPKVLSEIAGRPMISYTLENLRRAKLKNIVVVVGYKKKNVIKEVQGSVGFAYQPGVLGTADAAMRGIRKVNHNSSVVVVLNGDDSAFYTPKTINEVIETHVKNKAVVTFVSLEKSNPEGLGRVVRNKKGNLLGIVEHKEATKQQLKIKEVNDGLYVFNKKWAETNFSKIKKRSNGEKYIGDYVKIALSQKRKAIAYKLSDPSEWQGINTKEQLEEANRKMVKRLSQ